MQPATEPAAAIDLSGNWDVRVQFLHGERKHRLRLQQQGSQLSGSQQSEQFESNVIGRLAAQHVRMEFETRHEGSAIAYRFEGTVNDGTHAGRRDPRQRHRQPPWSGQSQPVRQGPVAGFAFGVNRQTFA